MKKENVANLSQKMEASVQSHQLYNKPEKNSFALSISSTSNGEKKRQACNENFQQEASLSLTETKHALTTIWKETLGVNHLCVTDNFFERGGNALLALRAMAKINTAFNKHLPLSTLFAHPSIETFAEALVNKKWNKGNSLLPIKKGGSKIPFYMVSYVGGSIDRFCELAYQLHPEQPVYGLQTPLDTEDFNREGFNAKEVGLNYIEKETARYISEMLEQNPDGPYALAGYSYGGFIALQMAKELQKMGKKVVLLAMIDTLIPGVKKTLPRLPEGKKLKGLTWLRHHKAAIIHYMLIKIYDDLFLLKHHRADWLRSKVHIAKNFFTGTESRPVKKSPDLAFKHLVAKRNELADFAGRNYNLQFYDGEIVLFRARKLSTHSVYNRSLGWKPYVRSLKICHVDGDHISMFKPFFCKRFAKLLQEELDRCAGNAS